MKVEQETHGATGKSQIRKQLNGVHAFEPLDRFNFHNHCIFYDEVEPIAAIHALILVDDWQRALSLHTQPATYQFKSQTGFVRIFEQPWPELTMNFQGGSDDCFCQRIQLLVRTRTKCKDRDGS